jgi:hypothetical protein
LKFLSVKSIVIAPASTGRLKSRRIAVINILQTNKGQEYILTPGALIFAIVVIKFMAPKRLLTPAKCKLKIAISTEGPLCETPRLSIG